MGGLYDVTALGSNDREGAVDGLILGRIDAFGSLDGAMLSLGLLLGAIE